MKNKNIIKVLGILFILFSIAHLPSGKFNPLSFLIIPVFAHCDTMDGPVIKAAQKAFETKNINLVLIWVQKNDEEIIKKAFEKSLIVREMNPEAKELADMYFFETIVRIHRTGEGAPYTGIKPKGTDPGHIIPVADKAIETDSVKTLLKFLTTTMQDKITEHFKKAITKKDYKPNDVKAGREYVKAYIEFMHYVERIYTSIQKSAIGHYPETKQTEMHEE